MKLPKLADFFPVNNAMAELYGGWLEGPFFKVIFNKGAMKNQIKRANEFLIENGFETQIEVSYFDDNLEFEIDLLTFSYNTLGGNMLLFIYEQPPNLNPFDSLTELVRVFRDEREWKQFHTAKNLSMAVSSEAGELLDLFLWDREEKVNKEKASNEIADILIYLLLLSKELNIDILESVVEKVQNNNLKYPVEKSKGIAKKYNEL